MVRHVQVDVQLVALLPGLLHQLLHILVSIALLVVSSRPDVCDVPLVVHLALVCITTLELIDEF